MISVSKYIILFFLALPFFAISSLNYNKDIEKAHNAILNFEFQKAQRILKFEKKTNPNNHYVNYLNNYQLFLKAYFNAQNSDYDKFIKSSDLSLKILENEKNRETASILSATISIQRAFIFFLWSEHLSYVKALMQGQGYVDDINTKTSNIEYLKIRSIYEVLGGSIPNKYKSYAKWFNLKGSAKKGIELIEHYLKVSKSKSAKQVEGKMIELYLKHFLNIQPPTLPEQNTPLLLIYLDLQTSKENAQIKINKIDRIKYNLPPYFTFLKAKFLIELQNKNGVSLMNQFIQKQKGLSLLHSAHYYLSWFYCANDEPQLSQSEIAKMKELPSPLFPADKKALNRIEKEHCNSYLVKSRMLFDAGEYKRALNVLKTKQATASLINYEQKIEYLYRLARIYENINLIDKALKLYQKVIDTQKTELYFVAFSAYRSGEIYLNKQNYKLAKTFFSMALELNEGEYKSSIESKCQYAIESID